MAASAQLRYGARVTRRVEPASRALRLSRLLLDIGQPSLSQSCYNFVENFISYSTGSMAEVGLQTEKRKWFVWLLRRANMLKAAYRRATQQTFY